MSKNLTTLTSLSMLKVNVDAEKRDYLEYLRPFVLHVLNNENYEFIDDETISAAIQVRFGLRIPSRATHRLLTRLVKNKLIRKNGDVYICDKSTLPPSNLDADKADASRHIQSISKGLRDFAEDKPIQIHDDAEALEVLLFFLSQFSIECLKTYIFGNTIPNPPKKSHKYAVLVGQFFIILPKNWALF